MVRSLRRVLAIARKELRQLARDRLTIGMIVGIPALQLTLFGYAINLDVRGVSTAVLDHSRTELSRKLLGELEATQTFRIRAQATSEAELVGMLERSEVGAAVVIPPDLDRRLHRGRGAEISILADASNPTVAAAVTLAGEGLGQTLAARTQPFVTGGATTALRAPPLDRARYGPEPDIIRGDAVRFAVLPFYNPERRTAVFIVPGLIGVILTMTTMLMTALAVVRERERGTFEFLIATPVRRAEVMVGKISPYILVGFVQVALILALGAVLFDVPIHGSLLDLGVAALVFIAAMLTMGLVVSALAQTQFQAAQMSFFFFLPSMLLSGFMFPFEAMPEPAQWIGTCLPLTHFLRIVRGILLKGAPLDSLLREVVAIAAFFVVALTVAILSFRKRLD
ncbi:MAG TPA: ABC transporter permease [Candidatus Dormibacteraeota bacterium]|nr:ABC transporter permease [Candidatus Dormibacteraeota bacterium]